MKKWLLIGLIGLLFSFNIKSQEKVTFLNMNFGSLINSKKDNSELFIIEFSMALNSYYLAMSTNFPKIGENSYGKGVLGNDYKINTYDFGYAINTPYDIYIIPFIGLVHNRHLYSDFYYGEAVVHSSDVYFNYGVGLGFNIGYINILSTFSKNKITFGIGIGVNQLVNYMNK